MLTTARFTALVLLVLFSIALLTPARPVHAEAVSLQQAQDIANQGDVAGLRHLLDSGFDVNTPLDADGNTLLLAATYWGRADATIFLLSRGANVNCVHSTGYTPLLNVIAFGHPDMVPLLLAAGARVDVMSNAGDTPLGLAHSRGMTQVVRELEAAE
jgi:ankyrin repeat protein